MSEIKALEKLRSIWKQLPAPTHSDELLLADMDACIKDIETEIAANYIRLPCDADGVPWTLKTESFVDDTGRKVKFSGLQVNREGRWEILNICVCHDPSLCRHVKSRTLEDVLAEFGIAAARELAADPDGYGISDKTIAKCVSEIRELLDGDAE